MHDKIARNDVTIARNDRKRNKDRRHTLRKTLLITDYVVEFLGSMFCIFVYFVGNQLLLQHILLTIGSLIYGVAIPLAFLLNESRVRDEILSKGWLQGFKAIFYSPQRIKMLERKKMLNLLHAEQFPLPPDNR